MLRACSVVTLVLCEDVFMLHGARVFLRFQGGFESWHAAFSLGEHNLTDDDVRRCFKVLPQETMSLCRALDPSNKPIEGRSRCITYKEFSLHENHPTWALRPYERRVGDSALEYDKTVSP